MTSIQTNLLDYLGTEEFRKGILDENTIRDDRTNNMSSFRELLDAVRPNPYFS